MENMNHPHDIKGKHNFFKVLAILVLITSIFMVFKTIGAYKENAFIGQDTVNTISFSGKGEVFATADIATFNFSVTEEAATTAKAQEMSAEKINKALTYLKDQGIEDKDIKTNNYNVYPRYEWRDTTIGGRWVQNGERVLVGYEVSQSVTVKVREIDNAGTLLSGIGEIGVNNISGLTFSIDDEDALNREARKLAIEDAQAKAEQLASDLGVKLVRIVNFNEAGVPQYYNDMMYKSESAAMGTGGAIAPEIPLGENTITSNITITYQIK